MFVGRRAAAHIAASNYAVVEATKENAKQVSASNDRMSRTLRENSEREVAARDRVDITLAEYTRMKDTIEKLSNENGRLKYFFGKIGFPFDAPILQDSIHKTVCCGAGDPFDYSQYFRIELSCDMSVLSPEQRQQLLNGFKQI